MALSERRILRGDTLYPWEREGIDFVEGVLPDSDPYYAWELRQLLDPSTGRFHEIDLLVLGYSAIYLMELKGGPGRYTGNSLDWYRAVPGEHQPRYMDPPLRLTDHKCKVVKSMLERKLKGLRCPRVVPLVFLSHPEAQVAFDPDGRIGVITRAEVKDALVRHKFPGSPPDWRAEPINTPLRNALLEAAKQIGLRARKARELVGSYELGQVIAEGPGYQDRVAEHQSVQGMRRRARIYLVPEQTGIERRQQLKRAADREVNVLLDVRGSPFILSCTEYVADAERGPTVLFDDFEQGLPLDAFLRSHPDLTFEDRIELIGQLASALAYCHKRGVVHGGVSPSSALVRRAADGELELRLFNFQLASGERISSTQHISQFATESLAVYQAPEVRVDGAARSIASDVYGLGAVSYLLLVDKAPGETTLDVDLRLGRDKFLDPSGEEADLGERVVSVLRYATELAPAERADDALEWFALLQEALRENQVERPVVSPLEAGPESIVEDLLVVRVLGHGASSRVLEVYREADGREYALKVSLSEEHDARLQGEAALLDRLKHARIVRLVDRRVIAERTCLLLELAGEHTLHRELTREGPVSLDFAARYGEDLLSALETLEEKGVIHRDIKPANLGVGARGNEAKHLTLFDFSLADAALSDLGVGTAAYRDPFLRERHAWDHGADRYSAAVTLHEMITGVRPSWGGEGGTALDERAELTLAAERFDASVRDGLLKFFRQALSRQVEQRFTSAREMRKAWERTLEEPRRTPSERPSDDEQPDAAPLSDEQIRAIAGDTPVEALPLSSRAKNALDRAGISRVEQLPSLAPNRLSAIRGIGTKVAKDILAFRERWHSLTGGGAAFESFYPGYRGEDLSLASCGLPAHAERALADAGVTGLAALGAAPKEQILALCKRQQIDATLLRRRLDEEQKQRNEREHPTTLEGLLSAFVPRTGKTRPKLEAMFGLATPFVGRVDVPATQVARHFGVSASNFYTLLAAQRKRWAESPLADELVARVSEVVRESGGACPLARAAQVFASRFSRTDDVPEELHVARAAALLRIAAELERERGKQPSYARLGGVQPWLFAQEPDATKLAELGLAADALAEREPLASPAEAARQLGVLVEGTPLATLAPARLLEVACLHGKKAAASSRLEVYPRGLAAERALTLSAGVLKSGAKPEEIGERIKERYPHAAPLPERPGLDTAMRELGFVWREAEQSYWRLGEHARTSLGTQVGSVESRLATAPTGQPRRQTLGALAARDFDQRLQAALEEDAFRVLGVSIDQGALAAQLLGSALGVAPRSFDELFLRELDDLTQSGRPSLELVLDTDRDGADAPGWNNLKKLAARCADRLLAELVPAKQPLLLHRLGLLARYELSGFLHRLVQGAQARDSRAVLLLVPCPDDGALPRINGALPIPGLLPGQVLHVPLEWIKNMHNAAA